jgi:dihydroorotate dehydrogenase electron transfer subunit
MVSGRVIENRTVAGPYFELIIEQPDIARKARAGQFVQVRCGSGTDPLLCRPMSIEWADADAGRIRFLIRIMGKGSTLLSQARPGDQVGLVGPLGNTYGFSPDDDGAQVLVAGGAGVAPLLFLAKEIVEAARGDRLVAMVGASSGGQLLRVGELRAMGANVMLTTDDATEGFAGTVAALFGDELDRGGLGRIAKVYACGPLPMMKAVAEDCARRRIACEVSLETYMACGTGICLGCMVRTKDGSMIRTCKEGPIFDAATLEWE